MLPINYQFFDRFLTVCFYHFPFEPDSIFNKTYINSSKTSLYSLPLESLLCTCSQIRLCFTVELGLYKEIVNLDGFIGLLE